MLKTALVLYLATTSYALNGRPRNKADIRTNVDVGHDSSETRPENINDNRILDLNRNDDVIPFYETSKMVQNARLDLEDHINDGSTRPSDDTARNFMTILGAVRYIAEAIADTCQVDNEKYEREYMTLVQQGLTTSWNNLNGTAEKIKSLINVANKKTLEIRVLIQTLCGKENDSPVLCNKLLTKILKLAPPFYERQTKLLLVLGKVATNFGGVSEVVQEMAEKQQQIFFLIAETTKELLKPLILSTVDLILKLDMVDNCMARHLDNPSVRHSHSRIKIPQRRFH